MSAFDLDNEDVSWNCDGCGAKLGRDSYVTVVTTSTGEVVKAEDGRLIDMEPQFPAEIEHLCYTCYSKKYKDPVEALRTCVNVIANVIELLEAEANDDFYNPKKALDKLNELVVYIAEVLPSLSQKEMTPLVEIERATQRPKGCYQGPMSGVAWKGCICPLIGTEKECLIDGQLCSSREGFILRDLDEEDRQERLTRWATKK